MNDIEVSAGSQESNEPLDPYPVSDPVTDPIIDPLPAPLPDPVPYPEPVPDSPPAPETPIVPLPN